MKTINLKEKLNQINAYWQPKIISELNGQYVKLVKFKGEFVNHKHDREDELFMVIKGSLKIVFTDHTVEINEGEMIIIPKGTEHKPIAKKEVHALLFEPVSTLNTGDTRNNFTVDNLQWI